MVQAEPVVARTVASSTGVGEPVIVWYGSQQGTDTRGTIMREWSDGTIEAKTWDISVCTNSGCDWIVISSPQMACRTDINGNGEIEFGDLLAVLNQWGDEAACPDTVQLQCGLMEMN